MPGKEGGHIDALQYINDSVGCIFDGLMAYTCLKHTTDGGKSWKCVGAGPYIIPFSFVRADFGYYTGCGPEGFSFYLYDHGNYSEQDSIFAGKIPINSLLFINDSTGFLLSRGEKSHAYRTTDYGRTWKLSGDTSWHIMKVMFPSESKGFCLTFSDDLYSTTDLGASWTFVGKIPIWPVNDLFFLDSVTGWAGGDKGQILKTKTGGHSWEAVSTVTDDDIYKIRFFSESVGYYISIFRHHSIQYILYRTLTGPWEEEYSKDHGPVNVMINPVESSLLLTCDLPASEISTMDIIDLRGRRLFHTEGFSRKIDVSSFSSGIYFLRYNSPQGTFSEKFIIKGK
jgi:photosystem II stability/assembly factor-like uncharacterized protein